MTGASNSSRFLVTESLAMESEDIVRDDSVAILVVAVKIESGAMGNSPLLARCANELSVSITMLTHVAIYLHDLAVIYSLIVLIELAKVIKTNE